MLIFVVVVVVSGVYSKQRIRNRWLVAYTLLRNPSLVKFTATNLPAPTAYQQIGYEDMVEMRNESSIQVHRRYSVL